MQQAPRVTSRHPTSPQFPCILLTGFDAFNGAVLNPSWEAAQALDGHIVAGHRVVSGQLPTVFGQSLLQLDRLMANHHPVLVICLGLAQTRRALSFERIAINVDDARIPDNVGEQPVDEAIVFDGPAAYFSSLPIKAMAHALGQAGIPAEVSQTAGTFVCNHVFYGLMHRLAKNDIWKGTRGGFVHVPPLPEQVSNPQTDPCLALDTLIRGLTLAVTTALEIDRDQALGAGALD